MTHTEHTSTSFQHATANRILNDVLINSFKGGDILSPKIDGIDAGTSYSYVAVVSGADVIELSCCVTKTNNNLGPRRCELCWTRRPEHPFG